MWAFPTANDEKAMTASGTTTPMAALSAVESPVGLEGLGIVVGRKDRLLVTEVFLGRLLIA